MHSHLILIPLLIAESGIPDLELQTQACNLNFKGVHNLSPCTYIIVMPVWHVDVTNDLLRSGEVFQEINLMRMWGFMIIK